MAITIAVVEDDRETRELLVALLDATSEYEVIGSYPDAEEALARCPFDTCDLLLTDIGLPGASGIELITNVRSRFQRMHCMVLTVFEDDEHVFNALKAGATGYLLKGARPSRVLEAIDELIQGGSPMTGTIARKVMESFRRKETLQSDQLTERENDLLKQLAAGLRYKEIADVLGISTETVRTHIRNIYQKLQVQSRTEALNKIRRQ